MASRHVAVILTLVWMLPWVESTGVLVTCAFSKVCVLPCSFKPAPSEVIHWKKGNIIVHKYFENHNQLDDQDQHYKNRTSLFEELISEGNASLLLQNSNIQDNGEYLCYTSTKLEPLETFINLKVHAPIQSVNIQTTGDEITCTSQDIFPVPSVSWTTDPPTEPDMLKSNSSQTTADSRGLFSVHSRVRMLGNFSNHTYFCSVTSADGTQEWTTSLKQQELNSTDGGVLIIPCHAPRNLFNFTLTWNFTRGNESVVILTFDSLTQQTSNHWKNQTTIDPDQVLSGNGSLWLQHLETPAESETYTCAFSAFQTQYLVRTQINFTGEKKSWLWIIGIIIAVFVIVVTSFGVYLCARGRCPPLQRQLVPTHDVMYSYSNEERHDSGKTESSGKQDSTNATIPLISGPATTD